MSMSHITQWNITCIPESELLLRRTKVQEFLQKNTAKAMVFSSAKAIQYLTGAEFIATERPIVFVLTVKGESALFIPRLELEHAQRYTQAVDRLEHYTDYPGPVHPMKLFAALLKKLSLDKGKIFADSNGYGRFFGYEGPQLSALCPHISLELQSGLIDRLKRIKSEFDIAAIRECVRWSHFAHTLLQEYSGNGVNEVVVSNKATIEATTVMLKALGPDFMMSSNTRASAGYRGQIGTHSYFPHSLTSNITLKRGDMAVTGAAANLLGYNCELERVFFVETISRECKKYYAHALALQDIAIEAIRPGRKCSDVDKKVLAYYKKNTLLPYWRHHTGHALGFDIHEAPFFDAFDDTIIEPGMVFSVEPGIYVPGLGGFRLSDTLVVTDKGVQMLTYYPRAIEQMICGAGSNSSGD